MRASPGIWANSNLENYFDSLIVKCIVGWISWHLSATHCKEWLAGDPTLTSFLWLYRQNCRSYVACRSLGKSSKIKVFGSCKYVLIKAIPVTSTDLCCRSYSTSSNHDIKIDVNQRLINITSSGHIPLSWKYTSSGRWILIVNR